MNKHLLVGTAAVALIAMSPAIAQAVQPAPAPAPAPHVMMHHAPMKAQSRAEVGNHVRTMFERLDTNRDGYVTKAEAQAAKAHRAERMAKRMGHGGAGSPEQRMANRGAMFDRIDANRDGSISRAEFEAAPQRQERRIVIRTHGDDKAGSHPEGKAMMRGMRMGMGGLRGHMFDMADSNKDGRVSLQEATAAAYRHFDMADSNRDGQITREERMQMHQRMRAERRPG